jgi:hypothetical protein
MWNVWIISFLLFAVLRNVGVALHSRGTAEQTIAVSSVLPAAFLLLSRGLFIFYFFLLLTLIVFCG